MKNIKIYIWLHVKLKCSQIMNLMTQSSRQRAPKTQLWLLWRPLAAAIKVRFWRSMGRLEDLSCTPKKLWWLVSNPRPLGATTPQKRKKTIIDCKFCQILCVIWKTPRIWCLNGKHYRQTSQTIFVGYLKAIRLATFCLKLLVNPVARGRAILEKNKFSRLTSCTALAKSLTKDLYSCDTVAGQVYVFDVFLYDT